MVVVPRWRVLRRTYIAASFVCIGIITLFFGDDLSSSVASRLDSQAYLEKIWRAPPIRRPAIDFGDGMAYLHKLDDTRHPIELLIEEGKRKAADMAERVGKVKNVSSAVEDYVEAFGMMPPEGFDV